MLKNEVSGIGANGLLDSCNEPCDQAEKGQQVEENDECVADFRLANEKDAIVPGHQDCDCEGKCVDPVQNLKPQNPKTPCMYVFIHLFFSLFAYVIYIIVHCIWAVRSCSPLVGPLRPPSSTAF